MPLCHIVRPPGLETHTSGRTTSKGRIKRNELKRLARKIGNLVAAIGGSGGSPAVFPALREAEARQAALEAHLATAEAPAPRLMPNVAELYREKVAMSHKALAEEDAAVAREQVRALIDEVRIIPSPADPKAMPPIDEVGVRGAFAGAMQAAGLVERHALKTTKAPDAVASGASLSLVAGAGFEPAAFRL